MKYLAEFLDFFPKSRLIKLLSSIDNELPETKQIIIDTLVKSVNDRILYDFFDEIDFTLFEMALEIKVNNGKKVKWKNIVTHLNNSTDLKIRSYDSIISERAFNFIEIAFQQKKGWEWAFEEFKSYLPKLTYSEVRSAFDSVFEAYTDAIIFVQTNKDLYNSYFIEGKSGPYILHDFELPFKDKYTILDDKIIFRMLRLYWMTAYYTEAKNSKKIITKINNVI